MLGERKAKNEALRRAFEASGRSIEDFAEMYGMELAQVRRALAAGSGPAPEPREAAGTD